MNKIKWLALLVSTVVKGVSAARKAGASQELIQARIQEAFKLGEKWDSDDAKRLRDRINQR